MFAFLDESHTASSDEGPGAYTMAAVVLSDLSLDRCRAVMESLRLGGSQKLHWREESRGRRRSIIEAVASLRVRHIVVTRPAALRERQERQKRLCLTRLLFELSSLGATSVTLESRDGADNNRDRRLLDALRSQRLIGSDVRIDHLPGRANPCCGFLTPCVERFTQSTVVMASTGEPCPLTIPSN